MANSANEEWLSLLRKIREEGAPSQPRNLRILELLAHTSRIDMTRPIVTVGRRKMGYRFLAAEAWWILTGRSDVDSVKPYSRHIASFSDDGHHFDGAYGVKVVDQLRYVVDSLVKDTDSRQAVLTIWRENPRDSRDIPCTVSLQWLVRSGRLHCFDSMRSSDAWLGIVYDWFNFSMLSAYILLMLRERDARFRAVGLGDLYLTAGSEHLYVDPAADGGSNVPYSLVDVDEVLAQFPWPGLERKHLKDFAAEYAPLNIDEFKRPQELLQLLEVRKDRGASDKAWLRELLGPREVVE